MSVKEFLDLVHEGWKTHSECAWYQSIGWVLGWMKRRKCAKEPYSSLSASWQQTQGTSCSVLPLWWLSAVTGCTGKLWAQTKCSQVTLVMVGSEKAFSVLSKRWKGRTEVSDVREVELTELMSIESGAERKVHDRARSGTCLKQTQSHTNIEMEELQGEGRRVPVWLNGGAACWVRGGWRSWGPI